MTQFHCGSIQFNGIEYKEFEKIKNHLEQNPPQTNSEKWEHACIYDVEKKADRYTVHISDKYPMEILDKKGEYIANKTYEVDILFNDIN